MEVVTEGAVFGFDLIALEGFALELFGISAGRL